MNFKKLIPDVKMLTICIIFSSVVVMIWYFFFWEYFQAHAEDTQTTGACIAGMLVFSAILPSMLFIKVHEDKNKIDDIFADSTGPDDEKSFKRFETACNSKLSRQVHIFIWIVTAASLISAISIPFKFYVNGVILIFSIAMLHSYLYIALIELDDPVKGIIIPDDIYPEWIIQVIKNRIIKKEKEKDRMIKMGDLKKQIKQLKKQKSK